MSHHRLPASISRVSVIFALAGSTALSGYYWYARAIDGDPVRLMRGEDGVVRLMSKLEALEERVVAADARAAAFPHDESCTTAAHAWRGAARAEVARLKAAGLEPLPIARSAGELEI
jgi:hypothetical protein